MHDQHKITAIKIEQSMQNLEHAVYEMQGDTARMQGQMSAQRRWWRNGYSINLNILFNDSDGRLQDSGAIPDTSTRKINVTSE